MNAAAERFVAYLSHAFGDGNAPKTVAAVERPAAYRPQPGADNDLLYHMIVLKRFFGDAAYRDARDNGGDDDSLLVRFISAYVPLSVPVGDPEYLFPFGKRAFPRSEFFFGLIGVVFRDIVL